MYLRDLHIRNLRLIRDLKLDFADDRGEPRMWTALIGRNGTGKTSILQAIALASVGHLRANSLTAETSVSMPDQRHPEAAVHIDATFGFGPIGDHQKPCRTYPGNPVTPACLRSRLSMSAGSADLVGSSGYELDDPRCSEAQSSLDPLREARSAELPRWFVAGYGTARTLAVGHRGRDLGKPSLDRLVPLFRPAPLIGLGFAEWVDPEIAKPFGHILRKVLTTVAGLVPDVRDVKLGGRGSVRKASDLCDRHRFEQALPGGSLELPANWLSHGHQATLAWLADLVGQYLLDLGAESSLELEPALMEGLVLIDQLDLSLHPSWQAGLVHALRLTFPRIQFVATTHSSTLLDTLQPDEVVEAYLDDEGNVQARRFA